MICRNRENPCGPFDFVWGCCEWHRQPKSWYSWKKTMTPWQIKFGMPQVSRSLSIWSSFPGSHVLLDDEHGPGVRDGDRPADRRRRPQGAPRLHHQRRRHHGGQATGMSDKNLARVFGKKRRFKLKFLATLSFVCGKAFCPRGNVPYKQIYLIKCH